MNYQNLQDRNNSQIYRTKNNHNNLNSSLSESIRDDQNRNNINKKTFQSKQTNNFQKEFKKQQRVKSNQSMKNNNNNASQFRTSDFSPFQNRKSSIGGLYHIQSSANKYKLFQGKHGRQSQDYSRDYHTIQYDNTGSSSKRKNDSFLKDVTIATNNLNTITPSVPSRQHYLNGVGYIRELQNMQITGKRSESANRKQQTKRVSFFEGPPVFQGLVTTNGLQHQVQKQISLNRQIGSSIKQLLNRSNQVKSSSNGQVKKLQLVQELTTKNKYLSQQIQQYKNLVNKLQSELVNKTNQIVEVQNFKKCYHELKVTSDMIINEMKQQIRLLLQKNLLLTQKLQETGQIYKGKNYDKKNQDQQLKKIIMQQYINKLPNTLQQQHLQSIDVKFFLQTIIKRNLKLESFAKCVLDMKLKVYKDNKEHDRDLKKCWRWLKSLIEDYLRLKRSPNCYFEQQFRKRFKLAPDISLQQLFGQIRKYTQQTNS